MSGVVVDERLEATSINGQMLCVAIPMTEVRSVVFHTFLGLVGKHLLELLHFVDVTYHIDSSLNIVVSKFLCLSVRHDKSKVTDPLHGSLNDSNASSVPLNQPCMLPPQTVFSEGISGCDGHLVFVLVGQPEVAGVGMTATSTSPR